MNKKNLAENINNQKVDELYSKISIYITTAKENVVKTVNTEMVKAYWLCGRDIVEEEQQGNERAKYGAFLIKELSDRLKKSHGKGFGIALIKEIRLFYIKYQEVTELQKGYAAHSLLELENEFNPQLSWTHYRTLLREDRPEARMFYEKEATENNWSYRELQRQMDSFLFDRLAKGKNKNEILNMTHKGQEIKVPEDAIKDPMVLEFLGLPESHRQVESKIEEALINNLQSFLLELGKGFAFIGRQKRLSMEGQHFYADLVFYHTVLKCYTIIDIKTQALSHADLGQMQLYVNYFDKKVKLENDNPTIGLVLCTEKNDTMAKYLLGDKAKQIFTSKYQFHLPTEKQLEKELKRELKEIKFRKELDKNNI